MQYCVLIQLLDDTHSRVLVYVAPAEIKNNQLGIPDEAVQKHEVRHGVNVEISQSELNEVAQQATLEQEGERLESLIR